MKILVVSNCKGGVGKTTVASNLANEFRLLGHVTVMVDMDSQYNLTKIYQSIANGNPTIVDVLNGKCTVDDACVEVRENLYLIPGEEEIKNLGLKKSSKLLDSLLRNSEELQEGGVEFVIIDTPPGMSEAVKMAYAAADSVLLVTDPEKFAAENMSQRFQEVADIQQTLNSSISVLGIVIIRLDGRRKLAKKTAKKLRATFGNHVFATHLSNET